jgi:hypothetical protein
MQEVVALVEEPLAGHLLEPLELARLVKEIMAL